MSERGRPRHSNHEKRKKRTNERRNEGKGVGREKKEKRKKSQGRRSEEEIRRWMENVLAGGVWCIPLLLLLSSPLLSTTENIRYLLLQSRPPENIPTSSSCPIRGNA
jgi:hypothetical protein